MPMIDVLLHFICLLFVAILLAYMVRHYVFSLVVLRNEGGQHQYVMHGLSFRPTVSILIPARNEEAVVGRLLYRTTQLTYPRGKLEVILINDASTDDTGKIADEFAKTYSFIRVIHRNPCIGGKGKPSALNEGFKRAAGEVILLLDADYYPQVDIVEKLVGYFIDPEVGVVQGRIAVLNEPATLVSRLVALERIGGYVVDQSARDCLGLVPQCGGTMCAIKRSLLEHLGGWDETMLTEDTDLTFQAYETGYKVRYTQEAECYEEAVEDWRSYWKQRHRWAKGHMQCFSKHFIPFLRSRNLMFWEKVDGLLILGMYFVPILITLSWILGAIIFFTYPVDWFNSVWALVPLLTCSSAGNLASLYEVGAGIYLDRRMRTSWIIPVLLVAFAVSVLICSKAFLDLMFSKITGSNSHAWAKTVHNGGANQ